MELAQCGSGHCLCGLPDLICGGDEEHDRRECDFSARYGTYISAVSGALDFEGTSAALGLDDGFLGGNRNGNGVLGGRGGAEAGTESDVWKLVWCVEWIRLGGNRLWIAMVEQE